MRKETTRRRPVERSTPLHGDTHAHKLAEPIKASIIRLNAWVNVINANPNALTAMRSAETARDLGSKADTRRLIRREAVEEHKLLPPNEEMSIAMLRLIRTGNNILNGRKNITDLEEGFKAGLSLFEKIAKQHPKNKELQEFAGDLLIFHVNPSSFLEALRERKKEIVARRKSGEG